MKRAAPTAEDGVPEEHVLSQAPHSLRPHGHARPQGAVRGRVRARPGPRGRLHRAHRGAAGGRDRSRSACPGRAARCPSTRGAAWPGSTLRGASWPASRCPRGRACSSWRWPRATAPGSASTSRSIAGSIPACGASSATGPTRSGWETIRARTRPEVGHGPRRSRPAGNAGERRRGGAGHPQHRPRRPRPRGPRRLAHGRVLAHGLGRPRSARGRAGLRRPRARPWPRRDLRGRPLGPPRLRPSRARRARHGRGGGGPRRRRSGGPRLRSREHRPHRRRDGPLRPPGAHPVAPEPALLEPVPRRDGRGLRGVPGRPAHAPPARGGPSTRRSSGSWTCSARGSCAVEALPAPVPDGFFQEWQGIFTRADLTPREVRLLEHMARKMVKAGRRAAVPEPA